MPLWSHFIAVSFAVGVLFAADRAVTQPRDNERDPHVVEGGRDIRDDPTFVSPPTLGQPIYACGSQVTVKNFRRDGAIEVYVDGGPNPVKTVNGRDGDPDIGLPIDLGIVVAEHQHVFARQVVGPARSDSSNVVEVTSHLVDYPAGLPQPRLFKHPLLSCGQAVLVEDLVPNAKVEILAEDPQPGGGLLPPAVIGRFEASTEWGANWTGVSPRFNLGARITTRAQLCMSASPASDAETVMPSPSPMPRGRLEPPLISTMDLVTAWGETGPPSDTPQHGAVVRVFQGSSLVGMSPVPGGAPHRLWISPRVPDPPPPDYVVTQALCEESRPSEPQAALPCSALPPAKIKAPLPGDTSVFVTEHVPGAHILIVSDLPAPLGGEIGDTAGTEIRLKRPLVDGEQITVVQALGDDCRSNFVYVIRVECPGGQDASSCSNDWLAYRHDALRTAQQQLVSPLADPSRVRTLGFGWSRPFVAPDGGAFTASPVVQGDFVYIGSSGGHLYAIDAATGGQGFLRQFPPPGEPPLLSFFGARGACANSSSGGVAASVTMARLERREVVILSAPDPGRPSDPGGRFGSGLGSGRLFALDARTLDVIWMSREPVARLTGNTAGSTDELHEQIGYSSPLVLGSRAYVAIADHCDNPIQNGRIVAVDLFSGAVDSAFSYVSTSTRGGGIWNAVAGGLSGGVFATTGNTRAGNPGGEPALNNGLSMIRLDPATGALQGKLQPVPFDKDDDPDWAAGAALDAANCGPLSLSTMKDGWTYAAELGPPLRFRWQFPNTAFPFPANDPNVHGDIRYHRPGAVWEDVFVTMAAGEDAVDRDVPGDVFAGYRRLHALNACAGNGGRIRWIADLVPYTTDPPTPLPNETPDQRFARLQHYWGLGPPTATRGIIYVGTNAGYVLAIADPSVWPAQGSWCSWSTVSNADCVADGFQLVPKPTIVKAIPLGAGSLQRTEPVLAGGRLFVATDSGRLFMLQPR